MSSQMYRAIVGPIEPDRADIEVPAQYRQAPAPQAVVLVGSPLGEPGEALNPLHACQPTIKPPTS